MQFGFRKHHATETATCYLIEQIKSKIDYGGVVGAVFLDLKKAFDTVIYNVLLSKLSKINFSPGALTWMKSYLDSRKQCTRINDRCSSFANCTTGVPQDRFGTGPLRHLLFLFVYNFINSVNDLNT